MYYNFNVNGFECDAELYSRADEHLELEVSSEAVSLGCHNDGKGPCVAMNVRLKGEIEGVTMIFLHEKELEYLLTMLRTQKLIDWD